jgi:hypothetical protein
MIIASLSDNIQFLAPELIIAFAKLFRFYVLSVPKNSFDPEKPAIDDDEEAVDETLDSGMDSYASTSEKYTLKKLQELLMQIGCVEFCCKLFSQRNLLQMEGIYLGIVLLKNMNMDAQKKFLTSFQQNYSNHIILSLACLMQNILNSILWTRDEQRYLALYRMEHILSFLQSLCDGQFEDMQNLLREKTVTSDSYNLIQIRVRIPKEILFDLKSRNVWSKDDNQKELSV